MFKLLFHMDDRGIPVLESVLHPEPWVDALPGYIPRSLGSLVNLFLLPPANERQHVIHFLGHFGAPRVYPWGLDRSIAVPDYESDYESESWLELIEPWKLELLVRAWQLEQEAMRACLQRWLSPGLPPAVEQLLQGATGLDVPEEARKRLARVGLEPVIVPSGTRRQWRLWQQQEQRRQAGTPALPPPHLSRLAWGYTTDDILALVWLDLLTCLQYRIPFRKCGQCGSYFASTGKARYCRNCRSPEGRAARQRKTRQDRPEGEKERAREWNRERMKAVRWAARGKWEPACELVQRATKDPILKMRLRGLKPGSKTYEVLREAGHRLIDKKKMSLSAFQQLFPEQEKPSTATC